VTTGAGFNGVTVKGRALDVKPEVGFPVTGEKTDGVTTVTLNVPIVLRRFAGNTVENPPSHVVGDCEPFTAMTEQSASPPFTVVYNLTSLEPTGAELGLIPLRVIGKA